MAAPSHVPEEQRGPTSCSRPPAPVGSDFRGLAASQHVCSAAHPLSGCGDWAPWGWHSGTLPGTEAPGRQAIGKETGKGLGSALWDGGRNETAKMGTKTSSHMKLIPEISKSLENM